MYSSPQMAASGAYAVTAVLGLMFAWITAFVRYAVTTLRTPPSVMSFEWIVAMVPSSKVSTATDQSSTSSARVDMCRLIPETTGSRVRLATSAETARTRTGRPRRRRPSQCLRWSTAPTGCEPILKNAPPPALFQRRADIDDVHVGRGRQRVIVREDTRDRVTSSEALGLLPCPGAHRGQLRPGGAERSIIRRVQVGGEPGPDDPDPKGAHAKRTLSQSRIRSRGPRTSHGSRRRYFSAKRASAESRRTRSARSRDGSRAKSRVRVRPPWWWNGAWTTRHRRSPSSTASERSRSWPW